jgi:hypothetical protein
MTLTPPAETSPSPPFVRFRVPNYVLMEQNLPLSPALSVPLQGRTTTAIYGFSDKSAYDKFLRSSSRELTPYPLVLGFLRHRIEAAGVETAGKQLHLVVIDAEDAEAPMVNAATVEDVIDARERCVSQLRSNFRLVFDAGASAYSVEVEPAVVY